MSYTFTRLTDPTFSVLFDADISQFLRIDSGTDPLTTALLLQAATDLVERETSVIMASSNYKICFEQIDRFYRLPIRPITAIISVQYQADDQSFVDIDYQWRSGHIVIETPPPYPPIVTVTAGYTTAASVPASLKHAIAVMVNAGYDNREALADQTMKTVDRLCAPHRKMWL